MAQEHKKKPYLNDTWTPEVMGLHYEVLRDELVLLVRDVQPPFAVAVQGGWGSGKTSLMRAVMHQLGGELLQLAPDETLMQNANEADQYLQKLWKDIDRDATKALPCVWFNPWQHQFEQHPMVALLHEIRQQFTVKLKLLTKAQKLSYVALKTGLRLLDDLTATVSKAFSGHALSLGLDKIEKAGTTYEKERFMQVLDSQRFQLHFETAIAHLASTGSKLDETGRLVIFIDDLDRCESQQAYKLLESIKLYLATRKCVFVLGLDPEHTVTNLRKEGIGDEQVARAYLHKLFQMTLHLPRARSFEEFIEHELGRLEAEACFDSQALADFPAFLAQILEGNPRRIKNYLNQMMYRGRVYKKRHGKPADPRWMALFQAMSNYYPKVYATLEEQPTTMIKVVAGLKRQRPKEAAAGIDALVARVTWLPQMEAAPSDDPAVAFQAASQEHYADARGLYLVLHHFKKTFIETFQGLGKENLKQLKPYLEP